jgi:hypothetical protein
MPMKVINKKATTGMPFHPHNHFGNLLIRKMMAKKRTEDHVWRAFKRNSTVITLNENNRLQIIFIRCKFDAMSVNINTRKR